MLVCSEGLVCVPAVHIVPGVGGHLVGAVGIGVALVAQRVVHAYAESEPLAELGAYAGCCVVAAEVVFLGGLDDAVLVEVAEADVELRLAGLAVDRHVMCHRGRPFAYHIVVGVVRADEVAESFGVLIPVAAVCEGVVDAYGASVCLRPFALFFQSFFVDNPESAHAHAVGALEGVDTVLRGVDCSHLHFLGDVLPCEVA